MPEAGPRRQEGTIEVDRQQLLPIGKRKPDERMDDLDPGIAHEDVDLAVTADDICDAFLDGLLVRHVHGEGECVCTARLDLPGGCHCRVEVEVGDDRNAAFGSKTERDLAADAARGTRDDRNS